MHCLHLNLYKNILLLLTEEKRNKFKQNKRLHILQKKLDTFLLSLFSSSHIKELVLKNKNLPLRA